MSKTNYHSSKLEQINHLLINTIKISIICDKRSIELVEEVSKTNCCTKQ